MSITIRISPDLQESYDLPAVFKTAGRTVGECLDDLARQFPRTLEWQVKREGLMQITILLNRETVLSPNVANLDKVLQPGDELTILSLFAGG